MERFDRENSVYVKKTLKASAIRSLYRPSFSAVSALGVALVIIFGGMKVVRGELTIGTMILFATYFRQLMGPMRMFARLIDFYQDAIASARRVFEVMDSGEDVPEAENPIKAQKLRGEITFDNVSFSYNGGKEILKDVSLKIKPGEKIALMGFVGSGKTTLAELVPRFYDVSSGRVLIDGYDVRDIALKSLRRQVGIVMQDVFIFSTTIRENIAFGKPDATEEEIIRAAKAAQIHNFVMSLPNGYDTVVGERGITLSGGQKQRLAISRALIIQPSILIFDDSFSNIDTYTEELILNNLREKVKNTTTIIISHRISTIKDSDLIIVIDNGQIIEIGNHSQLLKKSPIYQRLHSIQQLSKELEEKI